jgi:pantoate--beta-alanine ligase
MKIMHRIGEFRDWRRSLRLATATPFVPTMGALHEGHASLVRQARGLGGRPGCVVMASIFVNPTQFGPQEDFAKYPRTLEADCRLLEEAGCDAVFAPSAEEMYPGIGALSTQHAALQTSVDPGPLGTVLEGALRPGHFRGVCTVVAKLLAIVQPSHLLLGQKDFQQQAILRRMCMDLNFPVEVVTCPTVREADGLAMSSRNRYLNAEERARAVALWEALCWAREAYGRGERDAQTLDAGMEQRIAARGLIPQYALAANAQTLAPFRDTPAGRVEPPAVLLLAAKLGVTRLIDNLLLA